ncbi:hypothetical protein CBR_g24126 [Chara braunii]|uniref:Tyrosinase copper-binding domain-containing protein n=1 Tax=Chara braunii TaxID=69332 RepID=A0A388L5U9_CHABU|nr:hypothetical protein CBR_g24126 [Chara braunii]|eukprot:GBG77680.1 hypothetical protein CBR_g24126 [Chara braunii]
MLRGWSVPKENETWGICDRERHPCFQDQPANRPSHHGLVERAYSYGYFPRSCTRSTDEDRVEYKMLFKPRMTRVELDKRRRQEEETKFWVIALRVPLPAVFHVPDLVRQAMGAIILQHPLEPDAARPKLMQLKFELVREVEERFEPTLVMKLEDGELYNVEFVCKNTPWCNGCRWWYHTETDGCPRAEEEDGKEGYGRTGGGDRNRNRRWNQGEIVFQRGIRDVTRDVATRREEEGGSNTEGGRGGDNRLRPAGSTTQGSNPSWGAILMIPGAGNAGLVLGQVGALTVHHHVMEARAIKEVVVDRQGPHNQERGQANSSQRSSGVAGLAGGAEVEGEYRIPEGVETRGEDHEFEEKFILPLVCTMLGQEAFVLGLIHRNGKTFLPSTPICGIPSPDLVEASVKQLYADRFCFRQFQEVLVPKITIDTPTGMRINFFIPLIDARIPVEHWAGLPSVGLTCIPLRVLLEKSLAELSSVLVEPGVAADFLKALNEKMPMDKNLEARLDFFLTAGIFSEGAQDVGEQNESMSDHKPVILEAQVSEHNRRGPGYFKPNIQNLEDEGWREWGEKFWNDWQAAKEEFAQYQEWWDAGLRIISAKFEVYSRIAAFSRNKEEADSRRKVDEEERRMGEHPISDWVWAEERAQRLNDWEQMQVTVAKQARWQEILKEKGIVNSDIMTRETFQRLLSRQKVAQMKELQHPHLLGKPRATTNEDMCEYTTDYFKDILTTRKTFWNWKTDLTESSNFWDSLEVRLPDSGRLQLDRPVTEEKLRQTLKAMAKGKAPGDNCLPVEFFQACRPTLEEDMVNLFNGILTGGTLGKAMTNGVISLLNARRFQSQGLTKAVAEKMFRTLLKTEIRADWRRRVTQGDRLAGLNWFQETWATAGALAEVREGKLRTSPWLDREAVEGGEATWGLVVLRGDRCVKSTRERGYSGGAVEGEGVGSGGGGPDGGGGGGAEMLMGELMGERTGSWLFLPWHRAYLYFHELILGWLINDFSFTIPFWNWDHPAEQHLPREFTIESSSLYDQWRNNNLSNIASKLRDGCSTTQMLFGPHGAVHVSVGVQFFPYHDMGDLGTASRDPVFYVHHSNIDRLWEVWQSLPTATSAHRFNPQSKDWLDSQFLFVDHERKLVSIYVKDVANMKRDLRYTYEAVAMPWMNGLSKPAGSRPSVNSPPPPPSSPPVLRGRRLRSGTSGSFSQPSSLYAAISSGHSIFSESSMANRSIKSCDSGSSCRGPESRQSLPSPLDASLLAAGSSPFSPTLSSSPTAQKVSTMQAGCVEHPSSSLPHSEASVKSNLTHQRAVGHAIIGGGKLSAQERQAKRTSILSPPQHKDSSSPSQPQSDHASNHFSDSVDLQLTQPLWSSQPSVSSGLSSVVPPSPNVDFTDSADHPSHFSAESMDSVINCPPHCSRKLMLMRQSIGYIDNHQHARINRKHVQKTENDAIRRQSPRSWQSRRISGVDASPSGPSGNVTATQGGFPIALQSNAGLPTKMMTTHGWPVLVHLTCPPRDPGMGKRSVEVLALQNLTIDRSSPVCFAIFVNVTDTDVDLSRSDETNPSYVGTLYFPPSYRGISRRLRPLTIRIPLQRVLAYQEGGASQHLSVWIVPLKANGVAFPRFRQQWPSEKPDRFPHTTMRPMLPRPLSFWLQVERLTD